MGALISFLGGLCGRITRNPPANAIKQKNQAKKLDASEIVFKGERAVRGISTQALIPW